MKLKSKGTEFYTKKQRGITYKDQNQGNKLTLG